MKHDKPPTKKSEERRDDEKRPQEEDTRIHFLSWDAPLVPDDHLIE